MANRDRDTKRTGERIDPRPLLGGRDELLDQLVWALAALAEHAHARGLTSIATRIESAWTEAETERRRGDLKGSSEEQIRTRAYHLWEAEGRPEGCALDHWARAARELESPPD